MKLPSSLRPLIVIFICLFFPSTLMANDFNGYKEISAPEVQHLLKNDPSILLINSLSPLEFEIQHLAGSINIPVNTMDTTTLLPDNKKTTLVFHCMEQL